MQLNAITNLAVVGQLELFAARHREVEPRPDNEGIARLYAGWTWQAATSRLGGAYSWHRDQALPARKWRGIDRNRALPAPYVLTSSAPSALGQVRIEGITLAIGALRNGLSPLSVARVASRRRTAELVESGIEETFGYYAFPGEHWRRIRTNNPLERILREIRRRTRVVGWFPDGQSALNLDAARLRRVAGTEWSTRRYLSMDLMKGHQTGTATA